MPPRAYRASLSLTQSGSPSANKTGGEHRFFYGEFTISSTRVNRAAGIWALTGLILLAVNLRAAITGVAPVLDTLKTQFQLSALGVSILTTLPVLCLGVFASLAAPLAHRLGTEKAIAGALTLLTAGILLRLGTSPLALYTGTVLAGSGIALGNVLMPAVIKHRFPDKTGSRTGLAMMLMATTGALAAALAVPLENTLGWRIALAAWALPSLLAILVWGPLAFLGRPKKGHHARPGPTTPLTTPPNTPGESLLRSPRAWAITIFLGLVSLLFYALTAWLPEIMRDQGVPQAEAGLMTSAMLLIGIPLGFAVPVLAARMHDQRPLVLATVILMTTGLAGLLIAPRLGWLWTPLLGLATGSAFPLAMVLLPLRSPNALIAARLSGMAQTFGYLLASLGPLTLGLLRDITGNWKIPLLFLLLLLIPEAVAGLLASRPGHIPTRQAPVKIPAQRAKAPSRTPTR
ncbi:MFS transporter [Streptomyces flavidovirens]|uniref:CynX/NimT family MFS transporter n=1 Tax=Streptomyces flavidovirens TaxID=67298 RepID=UPI0034154B84